MKSLRIHEYGGSLNIDEIAEPTAGPGQVLVRVIATSFNPIDPGRASGNMRQMFPLVLPWIPGGDISGVVEAIGPGVTEFAVGDEVFGYSPGGGAYAERIAIGQESVVIKPPSLSNETAAAIAVVGQTAVQSVLAANLHAGQTILIHGGSGSVGTLAIQVAHNQGVRVLTTAMNVHKSALLKLGVDMVIDYSGSRFEELIEPVDAVLDLVGGDVQQRSYGVIKPGGILVAANQPPDPKECEAHHIRGIMVETEVTAAGLKDFADQVAAGVIIPVVDHTETLWNPAGIWARRPAGSVLGKIVFSLNLP